MLEVGWVELTWRCFILFLSLPCLGTVALISFIYFFLFFGREGSGRLPHAFPDRFDLLSRSFVSYLVSLVFTWPFHIRLGSLVVFADLIVFLPESFKLGCLTEVSDSDSSGDLGILCRAPSPF